MAISPEELCQQMRKLLVIKRSGYDGSRMIPSDKPSHATTQLDSETESAELRFHLSASVCDELAACVFTLIAIPFKAMPVSVGGRRRIYESVLYAFTFEF